MASRKSSILKPRKIREPLQDLNQLLPNNDEEETTTTEVQKRRVSFASINKVKEFEAAAECLTLLNTPAYDERFSISSDSCQSSMLCQSQNESSHNITSSSRRKSIQNVTKTISGKCSTPSENLYLEEDVELTETVGRICETSLKSCRADSSMELTSVISPNEEAACLMSRVEIEEFVCPLNLTKNDKQRGAEEIIVDLDQSNKSDNDSSSMETTEVITNNLLAESMISQPYQHDLDVENLCEEISMQFEDRTTEMSVYEVVPPRKSIFDRSTYLPPRKSILDASIVKLRTEGQNIEPGVRCQSNYENISMEMSALEISLSTADMTTSNEPNVETNKYCNSNSSVQVLSQNENKTRYDNSSMQLLSQNKFDNSSIQWSRIEPNTVEKTKYHNLSMPVLSQNLQDRTQYHNSSMQLSSQKENRTRYDNSSMQLLSQKFNSSSMQVISQNSIDRTKFCNSSMHFTAVRNESVIEEDPLQDVADVNLTEAMNESVVEKEPSQIETAVNQTEVTNKSVAEENLLQEETMPGNISATLGRPEIDPTDPPVNIVPSDNEVVGMLVQADAPPTSEDKVNEVLHEISRKSSLDDTSSGNDSNSPLTVGVNFSIFQKNKETRVEFSGTIDSNKKQKSKSISNVQVNIINNKIEKHNRNLRELRFSMPANKTTSENTKPNVFASFMDVNVPSNNEKEVQVDDGDNQLRHNRNARELRFSMPANKTTSENTKPNICASFMDVNVPSSNEKEVQVDDGDNQLRQNRNARELRFPMPANKTTSENTKPNICTSFMDVNVPSSNEKEVQVDDGDNQLRQNRNARELRFSMPANKTTSENAKPNVCASFMDVSVPSINEKEVQVDGNNQLSPVTCELQDVKKLSSPSVSEFVPDACKKLEDEAVYNQFSKPNKKRLSSEMLGELENGVSKRSCIEEENLETANRLLCINVPGKEEVQAVTSPVSQKTGEPSPVKSSETADDSSKRGCSPEADPKIKDRSPEIITDQSSFATIHGTPYGRRSRASRASPSMYEDDFLDENPQNNPSIIVNVGDSFSQRRSLELSSDNVSNVDVRDSPEDDSESKNLIENIASENISKENFVAYWLQNKTGNVENKNVEKTNSILSGQSLLTCVERKKINESRLKLVGEKMREKKPANEVEPCAESTASKFSESNSNPCESVNGLETIEPGNPAEISVEKVIATKTEDISDLQGNSTTSRPSIDNSEIPSKKNVNVCEEHVEPEVAPAVAAIVEKVTSHCDQAMPSNIGEKSVLFLPSMGEHEESIVKETSLISAEKTSNCREESVCLESGEKLTIDEKLAQPEESQETFTPEVGVVNVEMNVSHSNAIGPSTSTTGDIDASVTFNQCNTPCEPAVESVIAPQSAQSDVYEKATPVEEISTDVKCDRREEIVLAESLEQPMNVSLPVFQTGENEQKAWTEGAEVIVDQEMREQTSLLNTRKEVLEKILNGASDCKQMWELTTTTENLWTFQFLEKHLELLIEFTSGTDVCVARLRFVEPLCEKPHEIIKIAINSLIRKCGPKLKTFCRCVEDVPHVLKLIAPDVVFTKRFIDDMLDLRDSEDVKVQNGRASFYVVSYKNMLYLKIMVKIKNLDHLSINDIEIKERIGQVDASLVHRLFLESGRNYDFFSKFVEKLWQTLD